MDFSVLMQDLRDVAGKYQGKSTEPQVSTLAYVDMFTKVREMVTEMGYFAAFPTATPSLALAT